MKLSTYTKTGILVTFVGIGLYWGLNFMKGIDILKPENTFYITYDRIDGLELSSPVEIRGLRVGQVRDISFHGGSYDKVLVSIAIKGDLDIPKNTIGRIYSSDLMGTKSIELIMAKNDTILQSGDTINSEIEGSISDQVKIQMLPLKHKAEDLMESMEKAIVAVKYVFNEETGKKLQESLLKVQMAIDALKHSAVNMDTLMDQSKGKFSKILTNVESISRNVKNNNENISGILSNLNNVTDSLSESNLTETINNLNTTLAEADKFMYQINTGQGSLGKFIYNDSLYNNLASATDDLDKLLIDINANPKRYVHFSLFGSSGDKSDKKKTE